MNKNLLLGAVFFVGISSCALGEAFVPKEEKLDHFELKSLVKTVYSGTYDAFLSNAIRGYRSEIESKISNQLRLTFLSTGDYAVLPDGTNVPVVKGLTSFSEWALKSVFGNVSGKVLGICNKLCGFDAMLASSLSAHFFGADTPEKLIKQIGANAIDNFFTGKKEDDSMSEKGSISSLDTANDDEFQDISDLGEEYNAINNKLTRAEIFKIENELALLDDRETSLINSIKKWSTADIVGYIVFRLKSKINEQVSEVFSSFCDFAYGKIVKKEDVFAKNLVGTIAGLAGSALHPIVGMGCYGYAKQNFEIPEFVREWQNGKFKNVISNYLNSSASVFSVNASDVSKYHMTINSVNKKTDDDGDEWTVLSSKEVSVFDTYVESFKNKVSEVKSKVEDVAVEIKSIVKPIHDMTYESDEDEDEDTNYLAVERLANLGKNCFKKLFSWS